MSITILISLLNLDRNKYFKNILIKEDSLLILPQENSPAYLSTKEIITLHDTLEPFRDIYNIDISFDRIKISTKSDF